MAAVRLLTAAGALPPPSCRKGSGELLLYVRLLGETAPVEVPAMGSVADLAEAAREVFSGRGVKMDARPVLRYGGEVLTDHSALLADVGVCSESVVDADGRGEPTEENVSVIRVSGMESYGHTADLRSMNGEYERLHGPLAHADRVEFWHRTGGPEKCPVIYSHPPGWRIHHGRNPTVAGRKQTNHHLYGWYPSSVELLGQWVHDPTSGDAMNASDPYPLVEAVEW
eukprot:TRINITY_DN700_c0_g1_i5.p2 TRINITY_DN700_c0_g1~~TRINITY_DN700_c0_g1_i5.p2  ORF type:complete len:249 (+),score=61.30 TRINITY_DN700_c0_g1_i5:71-748(+)